MNKENLLRLAGHLETLPDHSGCFNMGTFACGLLGDGQEVMLEPFALTEWPCDTIACALGQGPAAGIPPRPGESWLDYSTRVFGLAPNRALDQGGWHYVFSALWVRSEPTARQAAVRIRCLVQVGRPPRNWSYEDSKTSGGPQ